jgi:hypothetical protein
MDVWERFVHAAEAKKQGATHLLFNSVADGRILIDEYGKAKAILALAVLLFKLQPRSNEALEWASQVTRDMGDVA